MIAEKKLKYIVVLKRLNLHLNKVLVSTDFFLVNAQIKNNLDKLTRTVAYKNKGVASLDVLSLNKEIKLLIRLLVFIKKRRGGFLRLFCKELHHLKLLAKSFEDTQKLKCPVFVAERIIPSYEYGGARSPHLTLILDESVDESKYHRYGSTRTVLWGTVGFKEQLLVSTYYRITNKMDSIKKILFFIALFQTVLKKSN